MITHTYMKLVSVNNGYGVVAHMIRCDGNSDNTKSYPNMPSKTVITYDGSCR